MPKIGNLSPVLTPVMLRERRRQHYAIFVFAVAYALLCALIIAPKGYFLGQQDVAEISSAQSGVSAVQKQ